MLSITLKKPLDKKHTIGQIVGLAVELQKCIQLCLQNWQSLQKFFGIHATQRALLFAKIVDYKTNQSYHNYIRCVSELLTLA